MAVYIPLQQKAYEYLKDKVVSGKLDKDQVYSESYFAKELKMSRTPVREALQRLVQEGYIDVLPSRGFVIHPLTESDIVAMYQIRTAIECFCLSHYAGHRNDPKTVQLLSLIHISATRPLQAAALMPGHSSKPIRSCIRLSVARRRSNASPLPAHEKSPLPVHRRK